MSIDTRDLTGARASSAVRCIARAEHEALGTERDENAQAWLEKHFKRGVNVGRAWAGDKRHELASHITDTEVPILWGKGWEGHADLVDYNTKTVYEAYHAAGGAFREEKALQAAFYADALGEDYAAELAVIDTTDVSDEEGFAVQGYEINVDGLREKVRDIKHRVIAAVEAGAVNMDDRVGDSPMHTECRSCPFRQACWSDWQPPAPQDVPGLEADFDALRILQSDLAHAEAKVAEVKRLRDDKRDAVREYLTPGIPVLSGDTVVKVIEVKGRTSVKLGDYLKAGYDVPSDLAPFVSESKPSERWFVDKAKP